MAASIWITGLGFVSSLGHDRAEVAERLRSGRTGIVPWRFNEEAAAPIHLAGALAGFDTSSSRSGEWRWPETFDVPPRLLRGLAPQGLYGFCALQQAFADADWQKERISSLETGLFTGSVGSPQMAYHHLSRMHASPSWSTHPAAIVSSIAGTLNFTLGSHFGVRGANVGFVSACASAAHAIGYAVDDIRRGRLEAAVILGAEDFSPESLVPFAGMRALTPQTDPRRYSPFDRRRDGFVVSAGATALCIEREDVARARGATPYAEIKGWGHSADGGTVALPDASGDGLVRAIRQALRDSEIEPGAVRYINAHATGTAAGDRAELNAIQTAFRGHLDGLPVSSTKHLTGHGLSMSGVLEAALTAIMLREGFIAGNDHLMEPDEAAAQLELPRAARPWTHEVALSHSSAFGGSNVVLALGRARD